MEEAWRERNGDDDEGGPGGYLKMCFAQPFDRFEELAIL